MKCTVISLSVYGQCKTVWKYTTNVDSCSLQFCIANDRTTSTVAMLLLNLVPVEYKVHLVSNTGISGSNALENVYVRSLSSVLVFSVGTRVAMGRFPVEGVHQLPERPVGPNCQVWRGWRTSMRRKWLRRRMGRRGMLINGYPLPEASNFPVFSQTISLDSACFQPPSSLHKRPI